MNVSFQSDSDALILKMYRCRAYCRTLSQRVYVVEPDDMPPRATILLVHGICEHPFRHFPVAVDLARVGYQILLFDLCGHGLESEQIDPFLWLAQAYLEITDAGELTNIIKSRLQDCSEAVERIWKTHLKCLKKTRMGDHLRQISSIIDDLSISNSPPFFLAGHSLGGLLAATAGWELANNGAVHPKGVILFSPAFRPCATPKGGWLEQAILNLSWASHHHAYLAPLRCIIKGFARLNLKQDVRWITNWISDIPEERELQSIDPLILRKVPMGYMASIERQMVSTIGKGARYPMDAIIFVPRDDRIVNAKGAVKFGRDLCASRDADSSQLLIYDNFWCHELLRSSKREHVLDAVYQWLHVHCRN